jgi:hypothetical protein
MVTLDEVITEILTRYQTYLLVIDTNIGEILLSPYIENKDFSKLQPNLIKVFHMSVDVEMTQWVISDSIEEGVLCSYNSIEELLLELTEKWSKECN